MDSLWALGFWATFLVRPCRGGEIWCATEPEEAFQAQQILARLQLPPTGRSSVAAKRKPLQVPGPRTISEENYFASSFFISSFLVCLWCLRWYFVLASSFLSIG